MVEPLSQSDDSFMQDLLPWITAPAHRPGARRVEAMRVLSVRHFQASPAAETAFVQSGLAWPARTLDLVSCQGLLAARRHPEEVIVMGEGALNELQQLLDALAPGRHPEALAIELTHGLGVIELHGPHLDEWLARLVDCSAIPAEGRASRCRFIDVPVLLARPAAERVFLLADRSLFPYLADWLTFSHEAAFPES